MSKKYFRINHYRNERDLTSTNLINLIPLIILWGLLIVFFDKIESGEMKILLVSSLLTLNFCFQYLRFYRNGKLYIKSNKLILEIRKKRFFLDLDSIKRIEVSKQALKLDVFNSFYMVTFITKDNSVYNILFEFSFFYRNKKNLSLFLTCIKGRDKFVAKNEIKTKMLENKINNRFFKVFPNQI